MPPIKAITFDLDDTLWPIGPAIAQAESTLHAWLEANAGPVAAAFPPERMRAVRAEVLETQAHKAHDLLHIRRQTLATAFERARVDAELVDAAFTVFNAARNAVTLYPDALPGLARLARRYPLASVSNGFADVGRIGIGELFRFSVSAHTHGAAKPHASIFLTACERFGCRPEEVLHVGDDPELDVLGAQRAGLQGVWVNRRGAAWPHTERPQREVVTITEIAEWLDA